MMCRPLCVDHVAPAAERFGADSEIADAKKLFTPGGASQTLIPVRMTGGRGKIRCGFGNYGREEAFYTRRRLPNPVRAQMTGGRGKIRRGFGNIAREEAFYTRQ